MAGSYLPSLTFFIASFLASRAILSTPAVAGLRGVWEPTEPQVVRAVTDYSIAASMCYRHDSSYPRLARLPHSRFREGGLGVPREHQRVGVVAGLGQLLPK